MPSKRDYAERLKIKRFSKEVCGETRRFARLEYWPAGLLTKRGADVLVNVVCESRINDLWPESLGNPMDEWEINRLEGVPAKNLLALAKLAQQGEYGPAK